MYSYTNKDLKMHSSTPSGIFNVSTIFSNNSLSKVTFRPKKKNKKPSLSSIKEDSYKEESDCFFSPFTQSVYNSSKKGTVIKKKSKKSLQKRLDVIDETSNLPVEESVKEQTFNDKEQEILAETLPQEDCDEYMASSFSSMHENKEIDSYGNMENPENSLKKKKQKKQELGYEEEESFSIKSRKSHPHDSNTESNMLHSLPTKNQVQLNMEESVVLPITKSTTKHHFQNKKRRRESVDSYSDEGLDSSGNSTAVVQKNTPEKINQLTEPSEIKMSDEISDSVFHQPKRKKRKHKTDNNYSESKLLLHTPKDIDESKQAEVLELSDEETAGTASYHSKKKKKKCKRDNELEPNVLPTVSPKENTESKGKVNHDSDGDRTHLSCNPLKPTKKKHKRKEKKTNDIDRIQDQLLQKYMNNANKDLKTGAIDNSKKLQTDKTELKIKGKEETNDIDFIRKQLLSNAAKTISSKQYPEIKSKKLTNRNIQASNSSQNTILQNSEGNLSNTELKVSENKNLTDIDLIRSRLLSKAVKALSNTSTSHSDKNLTKKLKRKKKSKSEHCGLEKGLDKIVEEGDVLDTKLKVNKDKNLTENDLIKEQLLKIASETCLSAQPEQLLKNALETCLSAQPEQLLKNALETCLSMHPSSEDSTRKTRRSKKIRVNSVKK